MNVPFNFMTCADDPRRVDPPNFDGDNNYDNDNQLGEEFDDFDRDGFEHDIGIDDNEGL